MFTWLFRWLRDRVSHYMLGLIGCLLLLLLTPSAALADGGAPNLAYIAGSGNGVSVVDVVKQGVTGSISVGGNPHMILLSLDGRFLYVTQPQLGRVAIVAASTGDTICTANVEGQPTLLALDINNNTFFTAGNGSSSVTALDMSNCHMKRKYTVPSHVYGLAMAFVATSLPSGSNSQLWVADETSLTVFDGISGQQLGNVPIAGGPQYISIPPGSSVYTATKDGNVVRVDLTTYKSITLYTGGSFGPMDYDETTGQIYLPDRQNKQLVVLDPVNSGMPAPPEPNRVILLNAQPQSIAITNDGQLGFAALDNGTIAMLDIPARQVISTIPVGGTPRFIITGLYPPQLAKTPQEAATLQIVLNVAAYVIIAALLIVPIVLIRRYALVMRKGTQGQETTARTGADLEEDV